MARLEGLKQGVQAKGIDSAGPMSVINIKWFGSDVVELTYHDPPGQLISAPFLPAATEIKKFELRSGYTLLDVARNDNRRFYNQTTLSPISIRLRRGY